MATVITPSCVAVPRRVETLFTIAYAAAPFLIVAFVIVIKIARSLPSESFVTSGTLSSPVSQDSAIETR